jgi:MbtH protein
MRWPESEDGAIYKVVRNKEGKYSIWPVKNPNPMGWTDTGKFGAKAECLACVKEVWTNRPQD